MRTLKSILLGLALLMVCGVTKAANGSALSNPTKDEVINTYLNAVVHGKLNGIEDAIDDDAQFNMMRGSDINTLSKQQILSSLKSNENIEQDCKCTSTVMQDSEDICVKKVEMKYSDFTRTDVVTAQRAGREWKITKVDTSFK
jgi:ABC-type lipoprotein release transport system permease subunit